MRKLLCLIGLHRFGKPFTGWYDVDGPGYNVWRCQCGTTHRRDWE
jgi:hypothetical protein